MEGDLGEGGKRGREREREREREGCAVVAKLSENSVHSP